MQYHRYDGDTPEKITKREVQDWIKRVRDDLRNAEAALRINDIDAFRVAVEDASGATGELFRIADATLDSLEG